VPAPTLVSEPAPSMTPEIVSVLLLVSNVPPDMLIVNGLLKSREFAPARNVPPSSVTGPVPTELLTPGVLLVTSTAPAEIVVPPASNSK
jgi:hypothetical protein